MVVTDAFLKKFVNIWSIFLLIVVVLDLVLNNAITPVLNVVAEVYIATLVVYGGNKEFRRWTNAHKTRYQGERAFFFWTVCLVALIVFDIILGDKYETPERLVSSYIAVLTILVITGRSKEFHNKKNSKNPI